MSILKIPVVCIGLPSHIKVATWHFKKKRPSVIRAECVCGVFRDVAEDPVALRQFVEEHAACPRRANHTLGCLNVNQALARVVDYDHAEHSRCRQELQREQSACPACQSNRSRVEADKRANGRGKPFDETSARVVEAPPMEYVTLEQRAERIAQCPYKKSHKDAACVDCGYVPSSPRRDN